MIPANPAMTPDATSDPQIRRSLRRPASRAASGLPPTANMWRPTGVCSNTYHTISARSIMKYQYKGSPNSSLRPMSR